MKPTYEKFYAYLDDLDGSYIKMAALLKEKIDCVESGNLVRLEEIMSEEQVFLMITKGFDKNIAGFRSGLGLKGETLGEIVSEIPEDRRDAFTHLHSRLTASLDEVKSLHDSCRDILESRLHDINKRLREQEKKNPAAFKGRDDNAGSGPHILSKSI